MTKNVPNAPAVEFARWELEIAARDILALAASRKKRSAGLRQS
jgi:hypothetical protein